MREQARSQVYLELARLWLAPAHLAERLPQSRRRRLMRLLADAGYPDLQRALAPRLERALRTAFDPPAGRLARGWGPVESRDRTAAQARARHQPHLAPAAAGEVSLLALLESLDIEIPPELQGHPDHLSIELGVMSILCVHAPVRAQGDYLRERLTWVRQLYVTMVEAGAGPAPLALGELTLGFLAVERIALGAS